MLVKYYNIYIQRIQELILITTLVTIAHNNRITLIEETVN